MSRRASALLIADMIERISRTQRAVAGMNRDAFLEDEKSIDAVIRNLTVIGEAANRLPEEFIARHPDVPWRGIIGLRHRVVHDYVGVDLELVWTIVDLELPGLAERLDEILKTE